MLYHFAFWFSLFFFDWSNAYSSYSNSYADSEKRRHSHDRSYHWFLLAKYFHLATGQLVFCHIGLVLIMLLILMSRMEFGWLTYEVLVCACLAKFCLFDGFSLLFRFIFVPYSCWIYTSYFFDNRIFLVFKTLQIYVTQMKLQDTRLRTYHLWQFRSIFCWNT